MFNERSNRVLMRYKKRMLCIYDTLLIDWKSPKRMQICATGIKQVSRCWNFEYRSRQTRQATRSEATSTTLISLLLAPISASPAGSSTEGRINSMTSREHNADNATPFTTVQSLGGFPNVHVGFPSRCGFDETINLEGHEIYRHGHASLSNNAAFSD